MIYVYLDESWDLWFDFENKSPSEFFTLTLVVVKDLKSNRSIKKQIEITIKRKINTKNSKRLVSEIKGSKTNLSIKKYLYKRISNLNFDIYSITFNKKKVNINLQNNKARLYNYFVKKLIDKVDLSFVKQKLTIVLDKSKNKKEIKDCNDYLIRNIETRVSLKILVDILHEDSEVVKQLQLADVFCYWFFEKYNKKNTSWLKVYIKKVRYDELWYEK